jgi:rare lipoprotein A
MGNGLSVTVRINDRGPYGRGRIIDVSTAAARELGVIASGTASVRIDRQ